MVAIPLTSMSRTTLETSKSVRWNALKHGANTIPLLSVHPAGWRHLPVRVLKRISMKTVTNLARIAFAVVSLCISGATLADEQEHLVMSREEV